MKLISSSLLASLPNNDAYHKIYVNTPSLDKMIEQKLIGRKGGGGFYRLSVTNGKKTKEVINIDNLSYKPAHKTDISFNNLDELLASNSVYGKFFNEIITEFYLYLASLVPSVTDDIYDIDAAMKLGYSWKYGPFELLTSQTKNSWDLIVKNANSIPPYLANKEYQKIDKQKFNAHKDILKESKIVLENNSAKLLDYKENLEFLFLLRK